MVIPDFGIVKVRHATGVAHGDAISTLTSFEIAAAAPQTTTRQHRPIRILLLALDSRVGVAWSHRGAGSNGQRQDEVHCLTFETDNSRCWLACRKIPRGCPSVGTSLATATATKCNNTSAFFAKESESPRCCLVAREDEKNHLTTPLLLLLPKPNADSSLPRIVLFPPSDRVARTERPA
jgi:hypothetical protein